MRFISRNEGLSPGAAVAPVTLGKLFREGYATPNRPGRRRLQDDSWWMTGKGTDALFRQDRGRTRPCPDGFAPGVRVRSLDDASYVGVVVGPSDYDGGVVVRFSVANTYPCSVSRLEVIAEAPADDEASDFEAWLQSRGSMMHDRPRPELGRRYRLDEAWHAAST